MNNPDQPNQPQNPPPTPPAVPAPLQPNAVESLLQKMKSETKSSSQAAREPVAELLAGWLTSQYSVSIYTQLADLPPGPERHTLLDKAIGQAVALKRSHQWDQRVNLEREKFAFTQEKFERRRAFD